MKTLIALTLCLLLGACAMLPEKSPTKLEKSPCACDDGAARHV